MIVVEILELSTRSVSLGDCISAHSPISASPLDTPLAHPRNITGTFFIFILGGTGLYAWQ